MPEKTAEELAEFVGGEVDGDPGASVCAISSPQGAREGEIAVLRDNAFLDAASRSNASILVAAEAVEGFDGTQIIVDDTEGALADLLDLFRSELFPLPEGISADARINEQAKLGNGVSVGHFTTIEAGAEIGDGCVIFPLVYIGRNASIGSNTVIYPHVTIMDAVKIGENCLIRPNAVIGDEGFGFIRSEGAGRRLRHTGGVEIGDNVEVGSMSSIDRGMVEDTKVGDGSKIDKHCMVAHNCKLGKNCLLAGYARMAGSVRIGDNAILAADVRVSDHKEIGENAVMAAGTGVTRDIEPGEVVWGVPTRPIKTQTRIHALQGRLPDLFKRVRALEKKLEEQGEEEAGAG